MTPFEAYKVYIAVTTHFKSDGYDIVKYRGRVNANESAFMRRRDASFFYTAAKLYKNPDKWTKAIVACILQDKEYVADIINSEDLIEEYMAGRENMARHYQEDLRGLLDITRKLDHLFIQNYDTTDPIIISKIHQGEVRPESAVIMDYVFRWLNKARSSDTLLWPDTRRKLQKYRAFFNVDVDKYNDLTVKVIKNHI